MAKNPLPKQHLMVEPQMGSRNSFFSTLGPLALGLSLGLQLMTAAFMVFGRANNADLASQLTDYGKAITFPEHEVGLYVVGVALTLAIIVLMERWWRNRLQRVPAENQEMFMKFGVMLQLAAAAASMVLYLSLLSSRYLFSQAGVREPTGPLDGFVLLLPGAMAAVWTLLDLGRGHVDPDDSPGGIDGWRTVINRILLWGMPLFIIVVIGVPRTLQTDLAGQFFSNDECHHLNFFMMGPALCFKHGMAFGTEIYSQYGIGWPLLLAKLSRSTNLTYGSIVELEVICGCVYYIGLFFLLRSCFRQEIWAAIGTVLAFYLQIFSGLGSREELIWLTPSSTMMRHPMDVWFFLMLLLHRRSGKLLWVALAGMINALAIFFETETSGYLLVAFFIYWLLQAGLAPEEGRPVGRKGIFLSPMVFYGLTVVTLLPLLLYGSRGTLFSHAFWQGWVEGLVQFGSWGVSALPMVTLQNDSIIFFMVMLTVYLGVIGSVILRCLRRNATRDEILLATVAAYGLALLLLFVNRSHPYNLYHPAVPFAVVLTALMFHGFTATAKVLRDSAFPGVLACGLILLLQTKAEFLTYPNLLTSLFKGAPRGGLSLMSNPPDLTGLPANSAEFVKEFGDIVSVLRTLVPGDERVAILDSLDTPLYCAANVKPWSRYTSIFSMALTKEALANIQRDLAERPPKYVVIRGQDSARPPFWDFVWAPLYEVVRMNYVLHQTVGPYEVWLLKPATESSPDTRPAR